MYGLLMLLPVHFLCLNVLQAGGDFVVGSSFTLADLAVFPYIAVFVRFQLPIDDGRTPRLAGYYHRLKERPSVKASWPLHYPQEPPKWDFLVDV